MDHPRVLLTVSRTNAFADAHDEVRNDSTSLFILGLVAGLKLLTESLDLHVVKDDLCGILTDPLLVLTISQLSVSELSVGEMKSLTRDLNLLVPLRTGQPKKILM